MRIALPIAIAVLAAAGEARAERRDCEVVFVRAPDQVRLVIETWLKQEPRCSGTIELRVVETESGSLYLIAQRPDGRIHEREVPDAQSAGVLVASWVADDWTSTPDEEEATPPPTPLPVTVNPFEGAPGLTVTMPPLEPVPRAVGQWLSLGGMVAMSEGGGGGVRMEADLYGGRGSAWTFGLASTLAKNIIDTSNFTGGRDGYLDTMDLRLTVTVAHAWRLSDNWGLRASAGVGVMYSTMHGSVLPYDAAGWESDFMPVSGDTASPVLEVGITLTRELFSHRWAVMAGPMATIIEQDFGEASMERQQAELMFVTGLRYQL